MIRGNPAAGSPQTSRARVRAWLLDRLHAGGVFDQLRRRNRKRVTVLQYHGVTAGGRDEALNFRRKHVEAVEFERQMAWLGARYALVPMSQVVAHVNDGAALPDYPAAVTFDDGFRNNYTAAFPVLAARSLPATIFVPTDFVSGKGPLWLDRIEYALNHTPAGALTIDALGGPIRLSLESEAARVAGKRRLKDVLMGAATEEVAGAVEQIEAQAGVALGGARDTQGDYAPLTWDELSEMERSGLIEVGSHTVSHPVLPRCSPAELAHELTQSKARIEEALGRACRVFSYPNGEFDTRTQAAVGNAGYAGAVTSRRGFNDRRTDPLALRRLGVTGTIPLAEFAALVSGGLDLLSNARARTRRA